MKLCSNCGKEIDKDVDRYGMRKYCSTYCSHQYYTKRYRETVMTTKYNLPRSTVGAMHELIVCVDLLKKGFSVFRSVTPNCSCDLAILKNNKLLKIEVKTGYKVNGKIQYPHLSEENKQNHDVLAVVVHGETYYIPDLINNEKKEK